MAQRGRPKLLSTYQHHALSLRMTEDMFVKIREASDGRSTSYVIRKAVALYLVQRRAEQEGASVYIEQDGKRAKLSIRKERYIP
jgi:hypothetical protein